MLAEAGAGAGSELCRSLVVRMVVFLGGKLGAGSLGGGRELRWSCQARKNRAGKGGKGWPSFGAIVLVFRNCAYRYVVSVHGRQGLLIIEKPTFGAESVHVGPEDGDIAVGDPGVDADYALYLQKNGCCRQPTGLHSPGL